MQLRSEPESWEEDDILSSRRERKEADDNGGAEADVTVAEDAGIFETIIQKLSKKSSHQLSKGNYIWAGNIRAATEAMLSVCRNKCE